LYIYAGREEVIDLTPLGSTLSLEAGVVGIALTHARKVVVTGGICLDITVGLGWIDGCVRVGG
jgi:hypothetical protein